MIKIKKILSVILCIILICSCFSSCNRSEPVQVFASDQSELADLNSYGDTESNTVITYLDIVRSEAIGIIAQLKNSSEKKAEKALKGGGYKIYTYYDTLINDALFKVYENREANLDVALAVTDLEGNLLASAGKSGEVNFAAERTAPYSSLKPLSVYAQGIEKGIINWSSLYEDSPYKKIEENGEKRDWPSNSTGKYSYSRVTVCEALKHSLNTVAVKAVSRIGVNESAEFLSSKFGIPLTEEKRLSTISGEEEIIGNIALGYLREGVSPVDMAGYYQIFANGGMYEKPKTISKICDDKGNVLYERQYSEKQVISAATADVMNRLLREVVTKGATGEKAACDGIQIAGKTGTGDSNSGNWFVGVTPSYSCAVWHGINSQNAAPEIFASAIKEIYGVKTDAAKRFVNHENLKKLAYCTESGLVVSSGCNSIDLGYYNKNFVPENCNGH